MDWFELVPDAQNVIVIAAATVRDVENHIESCENCNPDVAELPFAWILDQVTESDPRITDYILETPAQCPRCRAEIIEKTLIKPTE
jgi:hypothetical protein